MLLTDTTTFLLSWRGFLLGGRRTWHAHHRGATLGVRATTAVATPANQEAGLRRATTLFYQVLSRGGQIWGFGFTRSNQLARWGTLYARWRPGVLSNYFYLRVRRSHFTRALTGVVAHRLPPRVTRRVSLTTRWARLRRRAGVPARAYHPRQLHRLARLGGYSGGFRSVGRAAHRRWPWVIRCAPEETPLRSVYYRRWWRMAAGLPSRLTHLGGRPHCEVGGLASFSRVGLRSTFAQVVRHRHVQRGARFTRSGWSALQPGWPSPSYPHRGGILVRSFRWATAAVQRGRGTHRRRRRWVPQARTRHGGYPPPRWPAMVGAGGLSLLGATLLHEVNSSGLPFVHFVGLDFQPGTTPFQVHWSQTGAALQGVKFLLLTLAGTAHRGGLLRTLWWRLQVVA